MGALSKARRSPMATAAYPKHAELLPDDVLTALLALAKRKSGRDRLAFRGHDSDLQRFFRRLSTTCPSPLLEPFVFSDTGPEPYSPVLNECLSRLQLSGLVGRENPDYEVVFLRPSAEAYFTHCLSNRLSEDQTEKLAQIADCFLKLVVLA
jgi:hypothetical protein